jgi:hypothetical protein
MKKLLTLIFLFLISCVLAIGEKPIDEYKYSIEGIKLPEKYISKNIIISRWGNKAGLFGVNKYQEESDMNIYTGPCAIAIDKNDSIYIFDPVNKRINIYDNEGKYIRCIKIKPLEGFRYRESWGIKMMVDDYGIYILMPYASICVTSILKYDKNGKLGKLYVDQRQFDIYGNEYARDIEAKLVKQQAIVIGYGEIDMKNIKYNLNPDLSLFYNYENGNVYLTRAGTILCNLSQNDTCIGTYNNTLKKYMTTSYDDTFINPIGDVSFQDGDKKLIINIDAPQKWLIDGWRIVSAGLEWVDRYGNSYISVMAYNASKKQYSCGRGGGQRLLFYKYDSSYSLRAIGVIERGMLPYMIYAYSNSGNIYQLDWDVKKGVVVKKWHAIK